jgi:hypothetical protein
MLLAEGNSKLTMVSLPESKQDEKIYSLINSYRDKKYKICYLLLRVPFFNMYNELKKKALLSNLHIIDSFGERNEPPFNNDHVTSLSIPSINGILESINYNIKKNKCNVILIDTINQLLNYQPRYEIQKLANCLKTDDNYKGVKKILLFSKDGELIKEETKQLFSDLQLYADQVVTNESF